jgi:hypothetical protein
MSWWLLNIFSFTYFFGKMLICYVTTNSKSNLTLSNLGKTNPPNITPVVIRKCKTKQHIKKTKPSITQQLRLTE